MYTRHGDSGYNIIRGDKHLLRRRSDDEAQNSHRQLCRQWNQTTKNRFGKKNTYVPRPNCTHLAVLNNSLNGPFLTKIKKTRNVVFFPRLFECLPWRVFGLCWRERGMPTPKTPLLNSAIYLRRSDLYCATVHCREAERHSLSLIRVHYIITHYYYVLYCTFFVYCTYKYYPWILYNIYYKHADPNKVRMCT